MHWEVSEFKETPSKVVLVVGSGDSPRHISQLLKLPPLQPLESTVLSIRLFYKLSADKGTHRAHHRM